MSHEKIQGKILYTSNKPERKGQERGREQFSIVIHSDGRRTLSAHCEIDDAPNVLRNVCVSYSPQWLPTDAFVRLSVDDEFVGSGWMRFTDRLAECETYTAQDGRLSQRIELERPICGIGAHPIAGDALLLNCYDLNKGPGKQRLNDMILTSPDHRGATGPLLFRLSFGLEYVGEEKITVAAGVFDALHFRYVDTQGELPEEHPIYDVWCTNDGNYVFLKGEVGGYMQTAYELVELVR